jgi:Glycosyltransferase family 9 (heptosyltransferase)
MNMVDKLRLFSGKVMVNAYSGIGDAIILGPILRSLNRLYRGRILYPETPVLSLYRELETLDLEAIGIVESRLRRFVDFASDDLIARLRGYDIDVVFNLRRDRVRYDRRYEAIASEIDQAGVHITDFCQNTSPDEQASIHTYELALRYFKALGLDLEPNCVGWLRTSSRTFRHHMNQDGIGYFLGAGAAIKRMPPSFWRRIAEPVYEQTKLPLKLIYGATRGEKAEGQRASELLKQAGVPHGVISGVPLGQLTKAVASLQLIVSCDTFMIHLAEALGVPVVGVYFSTNGTVYGPQHKGNPHVMSPYYAVCPLRNDIGNCDGWDLGCADVPCKDFIDSDEVVSQVLQSLGSAKPAKYLVQARASVENQAEQKSMRR